MTRYTFAQINELQVDYYGVLSLLEQRDTFKKELEALLKENKQLRIELDQMKEIADNN